MCKIAKSLIILAVLILVVGCAGVETKIFKELPGADKIHEMSISYNKNNILPWNIKTCTKNYLCLRGTGKTFEDAAKDMASFDQPSIFELR